MPVLDIPTGEVREVAPSRNDPRYVATEHVVFGHALPFDADARRATGPPVSVLRDLTVHASGTAQYDVSRTGTLVYDATGGGGGDLRLLEVATDGTETPLPRGGLRAGDRLGVRSGYT